VQRASDNTSASSVVLTHPFDERDQVCFLPMTERGLLTAQAPRGLGDLHPFPGTQPVRPDSNSATIASTLNISRPTGSVGSSTDPPGWDERFHGKKAPVGL
jgi:hypothetical protein